MKYWQFAATGKKMTSSDSNDNTSFITNTSRVLERTASAFSISLEDTQNLPPALFVSSSMLGRFLTYPEVLNLAACALKETTHPSPPVSGETQT